MLKAGDFVKRGEMNLNWWGGMGSLVLDIVFQGLFLLGVFRYF